MIQKTVLDFKLKKSKEKITARSGLALFSELCCALKLPGLVNQFMPKALSNRGFDAWEYVHPLLLMLSGGGETLAETREIRHDQTLQIPCNINLVPSESAYGDWLRRMGERFGVFGMKAINKELLSKILYQSNVKEIILVNDPSLIKAEKHDAYMTYEGYKGYRPCMIIIQELGIIAHYEFRNGNDLGRKNEFFEEVFDILPTSVKVKEVLMDSEFYNGKIFTSLMKRKIDFAIAAQKDVAILESINQIHENTWSQCKDTDGVGLDKKFSETVHVMNTCKISFRLVVLRWKSPGDPSSHCYHAIATNMNNISAQEVIWKYNARANAENDIKELKSGFGMRKMPCGQFHANAIYFAIGILCHNLFAAQKILTMPRCLRRKTIKTIRWLLIETPGKVVTKASNIILEIVAHTEKFQIFKQMRRKNYELSVA